MAETAKYCFRAILVISCIFALQGELQAKKNKVSRQGDPIPITGEWEVRNGVKELYDTPLGKAYRFSASYNPSLAWYWRQHGKSCSIKECSDCREKEDNDDKIYQIRFNLFKNLKEAKEKNRRFVVLDFKMRMFPVADNEKTIEPLRLKTTPTLLYIGFSDCLDGAQHLSDIRGDFYMRLSDGFFDSLHGSSAAAEPKAKGVVPPFLQKELFLHDPENTTADYIKTLWWWYDTHNVRLIVDTHAGNLSIYVRNFDGRNLCVFGIPVSNVDPEPVKSISIVSVVKNLMVEVSNPTVYLLDLEQDFEKLPEITPMKYPYGGYPMLPQGKKARDDRENLKNPDFIYANALRYLEGNGVECDMVKGIGMLQDAVKDGHVFAMHELGLCYYRGMGVWQSDGLARKFFDMAADAGYGKSGTMLKIMYHQKIFNDNYHKTAPHEDLNLRKMKDYAAVEAINDKYPVSPMPRAICAYSHIDFDVSLEDYTVNPKAAFYWGRYRPVARENGLSAAFKAAGEEGIKGEQALIDKYGLFLYYPVEKKFALTSYHAICLDYSVDAGFTPAMLYKGYIFSCDFFKYPWKSADFDADALALFERGAALRNMDCYAHALRMKMKKKQDVSAEFKKNPFNLEVLDNPLYLLMKYCSENQDFPGRKLLIDYDLPEAEKFFKAKNDPNSKYLYSLINLEMCFGVGKNVSDKMNLEYFKVGLKSLKESVAGGIDDGLYLLGKYELYGKLTDSNPNDGIKHLQLAAKNGHIGAMWLLAQKNWDGNRKYDETMKEIKPLLDIGIYPEVWAFAAEVAQRNTSGKSADAVALYEKAAELGHAPSCNTLALAYYNGKLGLKKDTKKASEYWKMFLKFDTEQRNQDPMDIYYGEDKLPKLMIEPLKLFSGSSLKASDTLIENKYFDTFIKTGGEANPFRQAK